MALPDWITIGGIILGGGGLGGAGVALARFRPERDKLKAEAATILTASSLEMSTKLSERLDKALARIDKLEDNEDLWREQLYRHAEWDRQMAAELRKHEVDVPPPPALFLPNANAA